MCPHEKARIVGAGTWPRCCTEVQTSLVLSYPGEIWAPQMFHIYRLLSASVSCDNASSQYSIHFQGWHMDGSSASWCTHWASSTGALIYRNQKYEVWSMKSKSKLQHPRPDSITWNVRRQKKNQTSATTKKCLKEIWFCANFDTSNGFFSFYTWHIYDTYSMK